ARSVYGSGRVVAVGDSSAFDDGTCSSGNNCFDGWNDPSGDNNILFPNAVEWVASVTGGGPTRTPTVTTSPAPCNISFGDVHTSDYFYTSVIYLACHVVISGYSDGTFRPFSNTTRGQLTKIITLAEGWTDACPSTATFSDVPVGSTFFCFVEA